MRPLIGGPLQNRGVIGTRETDVLNTNDIERRVSAQEPANDVAVKVLVRCKPQHRRRFLTAPA